MMMRSVLAAFLLGLLAACVSQSEEDGVEVLGNAVKAIRDQARANREPAATPEQQRAAIYDAVATSGHEGPLLLVEMEALGAVASLGPVNENQGAITWIDAAGRGIVTRSGIIIATRGTGFDLMASDISGTLAALKGGPRAYPRVQRYLGGEGELLTLTLSCRMVLKGRSATETCSVDGAEAINTYTLRGGEVWSGRQWLGRSIGYAKVERIQ